MVVLWYNHISSAQKFILRSFAIVPKIWYDTHSNRGSLP